MMKNKLMQKRSIKQSKNLESLKSDKKKNKKKDNRLENSAMVVPENPRKLAMGRTDKKLKKKQVNSFIDTEKVVDNHSAEIILVKKNKKLKKKEKNAINDMKKLTANILSEKTFVTKKKLEKKMKTSVNDTLKALQESSGNSEKMKRKLEEDHVIECVILPKKVKLNPKKITQQQKLKTFHQHQFESPQIERPQNTVTSPTNCLNKSSFKLKQNNELPRLKVSSGFSWNDEFMLPVSTSKKDDSSSDESDVEVQKKEKTRAEIRLEKIAEEKKIYEFETKRLEGVNEPQTADDFDRLVLQSPDSSLVWTRYMAYHLECTEIDKARGVAERALSTISFRDEQEKLNIWVAYLNLENMYGTSDQLDELFERAKTNCDAQKIHERMISVYVRSEKYEDAEQLYNIVVKKFHTDKRVWLNFVQFCFRNNRLDTGRKLLQRSFKCLEKKEHVEMISKVAQMEIKFGDGERGRTMYENLVSNYPKRLDLWSVYIDMVRILGDHDGVRKLFERVLALKMNAKRMKFIFKKYLDFENQFGSSDRVAEIKEKALKYVETKGYYDDFK